MRKKTCTQWLHPFAVIWYLSALTATNVASGQQQQMYTDMLASWDTVTVLQNPHKGWYIHYYDNGLNKYGASLAPGDYLKDFKGLNHVYLRLAWSYLEPQEGVFNWPLIDSVIHKWTAQGYKITFRISCKETDANQVFATPQWVKDAGARGLFVGKNKNWEPDYDDPVFLKKLEDFHAVFGKRYGSKKYLEYIDVGSFGDWGEGHTIFGSGKEYRASVIKKHIDIYKKCYPVTLLMISDDFITSRADPYSEDAAEIIRYILANGISFRDDSVCVKFFTEHYGFSTLRSQYLFEQTWRRLPADLELEHYPQTIQYKTWKQGAPLEAAIREAHASYVGFHGAPREWLKENMGYANRVTNRIGYWYMIRAVSLPRTVQPRGQMRFTLYWYNHGVAPAYHKYRLFLSIRSQGKETVQLLQSSDNRKWMPDSVASETYTVSLPPDLPNGSAKLGIKLVSDKMEKEQPVELGMQWKNSNGYYSIGKVNVLKAKKSNKKKIVFFGDSITQEALEKNGFATLLRGKLDNKLSYEFISEGVGGNRVQDLVDRVQEDVLVFGPDQVVINIGVNDCGWRVWHPQDQQFSLLDYEQSLNNLIEQLQQQKINVVLCTPALIGEKLNGAGELNTDLDQYAAACRRVALKRGCTLVDLRKAFMQYLQQHNTNNIDRGMLTVDGVHPTALGNGIIATELNKVIQ